MTGSDKLAEFVMLYQQSLEEGRFVKASLGNYKGSEPDLKSILVKKVTIKRADMLSFTHRYKTRDIVKNYETGEGLDRIKDALLDFHAATLFATDFDMSLERRGDRLFLKKLPPSMKAPAGNSHDRVKNRPVDAARNYLQHLKITDANGTVFKNAQDKYKQINKYIEILGPILPVRDNLHIADMGSGKGYLTFALYDYLVSQNRKAKVTGVEYRQDMVDLCNGIAAECGFNGLSFVQGTIEDYKADTLDILIALHACDTATDDAIAKGVKAGADLIVVAPCCHKQIRKEMGKPQDLDFLLRFGTFEERQAEMVTDAMRCLLLESEGYATKAFEFISDAHTPKNVMIIATRAKKSEKALKQFTDAKTFFGIGEHYLEKALRR